MVCPKCEEMELREPIYANALSRADNQTYICSDCGMKEALEIAEAGTGLKFNLIDQKGNGK